MKQFPKATAFLQKMNMTVDEALEYFEKLEGGNRVESRNDNTLSK